MNVPTPIDPRNRDDRFNRGLERLLEGDPAGLDDLDDDLQPIALRMVQLANEAGWIGADPGESHVPKESWWSRSGGVINGIAALLAVALIGSMAMLGWQLMGEDRYASAPDPTPTQVMLRPGVCSRAPRTEIEIASIVHTHDGQSPFTGEGMSNWEPPELIQLTRDWNACVQAGDHDRAMAYESEYHIMLLGKAAFPNGTAGLTDAEIATGVRTEHAAIVPIPSGDGSNLDFYAVQVFAHDSNRNPGQMVTGLELWMVPMENGDWVEWPTLLLLERVDGQWFIVLTTRDGSPPSDIVLDDNSPDPQSTPPAP